MIDKFLENYRKSHTHPINKLTHTFGIPMIVISVFMVPYMAFASQWSLWPYALGLFVVGWILQFIGHAFEGKPPAFFENPTYLLIGPVWWILKVLGFKKD